MRALVLLTAGFLAAACRPAAPTESAATPRRIVALTVGSVDTLARLGALDRVVGVEEDCFVPGTEGLVKLRNDDHAGPSKALNVEAILALAPDLVVAKRDLEPVLGGRGVDVFWASNATDLDGIAADVRALGARIGLDDRAEEVGRVMRAEADAIAAEVAALPRVRVYYEAGRAGRTVGRGTVVDAMLRLAGGVNVAGDLPLANPVLTSEAILAADPEVIVLSPWSDAPEEVALRPGWERTSAVRAGRVHRLSERERRVQYPGPSCVDGCRSELLSWIHPELARAGAARR